MTDTAAPVRLGFLYPDFSAEDDYPRLAARLHPPVEAVVVHTSIGEDAHRVDALLDTGAAWRLAEGAERLRATGVRAAMWACTSGSFVFGLAGAQEQARGVAAAAEDHGKDREKRDRQDKAERQRPAVTPQGDQTGSHDGKDQSRNSLPVS